MASHSDTVGNAAAMREALISVRRDLWDMMGTTSEALQNRIAANIRATIRAALAIPLRNCDVGTAEEQLRRWRKYCENFHYCGDCPADKKDGLSAYCFAKWAQMPYEAAEGEGDERQ